MPVYRLRGVVQHYAWGGTEFLPNLLQQSNREKQPWAEYWLGVHPKGPTQVLTGDGEVSLNSFLSGTPGLLSANDDISFDGLPFLLKILDVKQMLSIQLHPTIDKAKAGFAREEELGIPVLAPNRNYRDQNHKPEMMVALTDFWLLHGFRSKQEIRESLQNVPGWEDLLPTLEEEGVRGLYQKVMEADQAAVNEWMAPLYQHLSGLQATLSQDQTDYWAWQAFQQYSRDGKHDRGIFSIYWFNLVNLEPGQGIFQGAGIPHAYLRGVNVELMANSDNVLRGGLTPKHIDVPELLDNIIVDAVVPNIQEGVEVEKNCMDYPVPVPDFKLLKVILNARESNELSAKNASICLIMSGLLQVDGKTYVAGESFLLTAGQSVHLNNPSKEELVLFSASF